MSAHDEALNDACTALGLRVDLEARVGWWGPPERGIHYRAIVYSGDQPIFATTPTTADQAIVRTLTWLETCTPA